MNGQAALSTSFVHLLGAILTLMPLGHRQQPAIAPEPKPRTQVEAQTPVLALVAESGQRSGRGGFGPILSAEMSCQQSPPVDTDAEPDFPLFGDGRPFLRVPRARWSPVFCAHIGRNGRILELHLAGTGSGNPAADRTTLIELAHLRFQPARRGGAPVAAWHRIRVNLRGTIPDPGTDNPTACLMPGGTSPCEIEPIPFVD